MIKKKLLRLLGVLLFIDGALLLIFGRRYVRRWAVGAKKSLYRRAIDWLANRPSWALRVAGVAEAGLGLTVLRRAPIEVRSLYRVVSRFFDVAAPVWIDWLFPDAYVELDKALSAYVRPGASILDLGCGTGANLKRLLQLDLPFGSYIGVDLSEDMLARAKEKFSGIENARFLQRDIIDDPLPEGPFDTITSTRVLEHIPNPILVVNKAWERLRPGGHMILLFQTESRSWSGRLAAWFTPIFSSRFIRKTEYERFPGIISTHTFPAVGGPVVLIILQK